MKVDLLWFSATSGVYHDVCREGRGVDDNVLGAVATSEAVYWTCNAKILHDSKPAVPGVEETLVVERGLDYPVVLPSKCDTKWVVATTNHDLSTAGDYTHAYVGPNKKIRVCDWTAWSLKKPWSLTDI